MVEKISEINLRLDIDVGTDFSSDDNVLLSQITKRIKQESGGDRAIPEIQAESEMRSREMMTTAYGRGGYQTELGRVKHAIPASSGQETEFHQQGKGEKLFPASAMLNAVSKTMCVGKTESNPSAIENKSPATSEMPLRLKMHFSPVAFKPCSSVLDDKNVVSNRRTDELGTAETKSEPLNQQKRFKDKARLSSPLWQAAIPSGYQSLMAEEQAAKSHSMTAMFKRLENLANLAAQTEGTTNNSQVLELNYRFQRWRGEHSVRISIPSGIRREGNVTMLPSGLQAADMLLRHVEQLDGLSPELLDPLQDEEQE